MKKIFLLLISMALILTACSSRDKNSSSKIQKEDLNLSKLVSQIYEKSNLDQNTKKLLKDSVTKELQINDKDNINSFFGGDYKFKKAVVSELQQLPPAYLLSLIEAESNDDAIKIASEIEKSFNIKRWVCVEPEVVKTSVKDNVVILVASDKTTADELIKNFEEIK